MNSPLIFFDATCPFCWRSIAFVLKIDTQERFLFAPLAGQTAAETLKASLQQENSMVLVENPHSTQERIWLRGRAAFRILWILGGTWRLLGWFCFVPFGTDLLYRLIARHRHRLSTPVINSMQTHPQRFLP